MTKEIARKEISLEAFILSTLMVLLMMNLSLQVNEKGFFEAKRYVEEDKKAQKFLPVQREISKSYSFYTQRESQIQMQVQVVNDANKKNANSKKLPQLGNKLFSLAPSEIIRYEKFRRAKEDSRNHWITWSARHKKEFTW